MTVTEAAPVLSVVIACYNEEGVLEASFREIHDTLKDFGQPWEMVFVDDMSTDRTRLILDSLVKGNLDLPLRVILHDTNKGRGATVTDGFRAARTMNSVSQNQPGSRMSSRTGSKLLRRQNLYPVSVS